MKLLTMIPAAAVIAGSVLTLASASASAGSVVNPGATVHGDMTSLRGALVQEVKHRKRTYRRHRHGRRYRTRRPGFDFYYDGYYYGYPWWTAPGVGFSVTVPVAPINSAHVDWCLRRFRSYDVRTDSYMGYDGYRHRCNSPFR